MTAIPVYEPVLCGNEQKYVSECLESTWISSKGRFIQEFEESFAKYLDVAHAASVCNGTAALHLTLLALGVGPGDEVIVPSLTYVATVNAVRYVGAIPVFADSEEDTWQIKVGEIERLICSRTKAVIAVHLYGGACDIAEIAELCSRKNIFLIEDCAEAIGTTVAGRKVGTYGNIAAFSFFGNKTITTGEGGMVVSRERKLIERACLFRGQGLSRGKEYWHEVVGYNYRMTNICAAIGLAQLEQIEEILNRKAFVAEVYRELLSSCPVYFQKNRVNEQTSNWMITVVTPSTDDRDAIRQELGEHSIETRPIFNPVHLMPMYYDSRNQLPVAEKLGCCGVTLPSGPNLSRLEIERVTSIIRCYKWKK